MERYKFHKLKQYAYENTQQFVPKFKQQAMSFEYGDFQITMLRDQFVLCIYDDNIRKRLMS